MYDVTIENLTGIMDFKFDTYEQADTFCQLFKKSNPHYGDRRSYRVYKNNKMVDHEEFA